VKPFLFMTSVQSVQLTGLKAASLGELYQGLQEVNGSSIYHHTHRFYRAFSFLGPQDRSDFALWVGNNLKEEALAELMGSLDMRDYHSIRDLRNALLETMESLRETPERWNRRVIPGLEFHFCRSTSLILPAGYQACNLEEFLYALERVDVSCLYYHLIEAPLHFESEQRFNNDFSLWLAGPLGLEDSAQRVAEIDPYRFDLETIRENLISVFRQDRLKAAVQRALERVERNPTGDAASSWLKRWRKGE
jgi:hypothetical protein